MVFLSIVSTYSFSETKHKAYILPILSDDPAIHHVDLSRSTGIRELGFNRTHLADVYILVSRLPRPSMLQTLSYTINGRDREHLKEGCLRKLDTYLARHCTSLKRFILRCDSSGDESGELAIRSFLPESSKKGILHLTIQGNHSNTEKIGKSTFVPHYVDTTCTQLS